MYITDLALIGSPQQWLIILLFALVVFAPRTLPAIGRMLGLLLGLSIRVRNMPPSARRRPAEPAIEILPPDPPLPPLPRPDTAVRARKPSGIAGISPVIAFCIVASAVAVLLWILLHAR